MAQRLKGVFYREGGHTHLLAKVHFTGAAQFWLWIALLLTLMAVGLLVYTSNIVMWILIGMTGTFLLVAAAVMWLDRYRLTQLVRRCLKE
jgi:hypothetical protein